MHLRGRTSSVWDANLCKLAGGPLSPGLFFLPQEQQCSGSSLVSLVLFLLCAALHGPEHSVLSVLLREAAGAAPKWLQNRVAVGVDTWANTSARVPCRQVRKSLCMPARGGVPVGRCDTLTSCGCQQAWCGDHTLQGTACAPEKHMV